jgi:hypothetical protein
MRDVLIHGVGALFSYAAILGGIVMGVATAATTLDEIGAITLILLTAGTMGGIAAIAVVLGSAWLLWSGVVLLISWLRRRHDAPHLGVSSLVPVTGEKPPLGDWVEMSAAWYERAIKGRLWASYFVLLALELALELAGGKPFFMGEAPMTVLKAGLGGAIAQLVVLAVMLIPTLYTAHWAVWSSDRIRRVFHLLRKQREEQPTIETLTANRAEATGTAELADEAPLIAPLSGKTCLGFWLVGRVGNALIDDVDATSMTVGSEDYKVLVRGERLFLELSEPANQVLELDEKQKGRMKRFLTDRGLPLSEDVDLGETLLEPGTRVTVHGAESREMAGSAGYREATSRVVIDDSDGLPVVVFAL